MSNARTAPRSSYITAIVKVASEYAKTDEQKAIIENVKNGFSKHDLILLCNTLNALNELKDESNDFRQVAGKVVTAQFHTYIFGFLDTGILLGGSVHSLATGDYLNAIWCPVICYLLEGLKKYLERIHKDEKVFDNDEFRETRGCGLKAPHLSDMNLVGNTVRIISNTYNFVHSNFLFFKSNCNSVLEEVITEPYATPRIGGGSVVV